MSPSSPDTPSGFAHLVDVHRRAFVANARKGAIHVSASDGGAPVSKVEVRKRIERVSAALLTRAVPPGARLVVWSDPRLEALEIELGAARVGVATVFLDPTLEAPDAGTMLDEIDPAIVFVAPGAPTAGAARALASQPVTVVHLDPPVGGETDPEHETWSEFLESGGEALRFDPVFVRQRLAEVTPDDLATIVHRRGPAGSPLGVALTQGNLAAAIGNLVRGFEVASTDVLRLERPATDLPQRLLAHAVLTRGGSLVFPGADATEAAGAAPEGTFGPPATLALRTPEQIRRAVSAFTREESETRRRRKRLARVRRASGRRLRRGLEGSSPRFCDRLTLALGGRALLGRLRARFGDRLRLVLVDAPRVDRTAATLLAAAGFDVQLVLGYEEASWLVATSPVARARPGVWLLPARGLEVEVDLDTEILVRGSGMTRGYWKQPAETRLAIENRWFHTGLKGWIEADGSLRISGTTARRRRREATVGPDLHAPQRAA